MNIKSGFGLLKEAFNEWKDDDALELGAALAYYTIFSIAPMLLVVIAIVGLIYGREAVQGQIVGQIQGLVGRQGAEAVQTMLANAGQQKGTGIWATVVGLVTILFGATGVFVQLQSSLNRVWDVQVKKDRGVVKGLVKARIAAFGMLLGIGFLLLVSLVVSTLVAGLGEYANRLFPGAEVLIKILTFVLSFGLATVLFAMIYRFLPDVKIQWRDVWFGAGVTALLFAIGKYLIGLYLGNSSVASTYGAAGSLVILLLWIYYSTQILFFGAELTQAWAKHHGSRIEPSKDAVPVEKITVRKDTPGQTKEGQGRRDPNPRPAGRRV
jgi:membrane protein